MISRVENSIDDVKMMSYVHQCYKLIMGNIVTENIVSNFAEYNCTDSNRLQELCMTSAQQ